MALCTLHLCAEKDLRGHGHVVQRHAKVAQVVGDCGIIPWVAVGGQQRLDKIVIRDVAADLIFEPRDIVDAAVATAFAASRFCA